MAARGALAFLTGVLQGRAANVQGERKAAQSASVEQNKYDMAVRAASDPMHPDYWALKNTQSLIASRLLSGEGGQQHVMGLEGFVDSFLGSTENMPVSGEDSHYSLMAGVSSGLSWGEFASGKDEWVHKQTKLGRAVAGASQENGLDLGKDISGNDISLSPDRYGKGLSQIEFLDEAVDEFSAYVPFLTGNNPDMQFQMFASEPSRGWDSDRQAEETRKFEVAKSFWGGGFGGAFIEAQRNGAPQAAHQALDRMARAQGILNARVLAKASPNTGTTPQAVETNTVAERSSRDEYIFRDEAASYARDNQPVDAARPEQDRDPTMHPALQVPPGASQEAMDVQFGKVNEVVQQINENPGAVTPPMLEFLELKMQQGFWGHIITPAIERFRKVMDEAAAQDQMDALQSEMSRGRPKTHMLGGQY